MREAMKIAKERGKSKTKYRKCKGELQKITSLVEYEDEDANKDGKVG